MIAARAAPAAPSRADDSAQPRDRHLDVGNHESGRPVAAIVEMRIATPSAISSVVLGRKSLFGGEKRLVLSATAYAASAAMGLTFSFSPFLARARESSPSAKTRLLGLGEPRESGASRA
jgi:hypothetical protein